MKTLATLALLVATSTVAMADDAKVKLEYKFAVGDVIRSKVVHLSTVETKIKGSTQTAQSRSISTKNWKVEEVNADGEATFIHSVENIDMWQKVTDRPEQRYNSEKDEVPPAIYSEAAKSVGIPLAKITVDAMGRLVDRQQLGGTPSSESQILPILPNEPVAVGAAWYSPDDISVRAGNGAMKHIKTRQVFRLKSVSGGIATISTETQILTPIDDPMLKVELIQKLTRGTVKFDIEAGRVASQQLDLDETIIGFQGETSVMNYLGRMTEELIQEAPAKVASVPMAPKKLKESPAPASPTTKPVKSDVTESKSWDKIIKGSAEQEPFEVDEPAAKLASKPERPRVDGVPTLADPSTKPVEEEELKLGLPE
ncbi:hypothetical protein C5Y96_22055 [Blastopirellula marina]|uniref:SLA1 homology domain-containing protein n=1 Tax=Blastopirellula marina TaxID=124 RepID=A0A2S8F2I9_9BACT|nr:MULTISPECIES: hypothetical protein [Pirellulaceae]PQO26134.1 hypothetical protein C5Y96_22055 [Blastopirellula marina]RCS44493.1 hypothetical protein DTL36_22100 [Bremerella cremea]